MGAEILWQAVTSEAVRQLVGYPRFGHAGMMSPRESAQIQSVLSRSAQKATGTTQTGYRTTRVQGSESVF